MYGHGRIVYLDVLIQLHPGDLEPIVECELKEVVEDGGGHVVQLDQVL